jgi:hypothetical protein
MQTPFLFDAVIAYKHFICCVTEGPDFHANYYGKNLAKSLSVSILHPLLG